ncbi:DUF4241 domain-containing protein [Aurantimonas sp. C2-6-R+9]|nr:MULTISPECIES: DUF4241 domain-containing protein [unclassified Aurantimonas]MEC5293106.1 DUF4241 domain-containing protein [Aurantimonas sp. C2-3-R2]MEC5383212.1 DUF4241 domain-containing protein [Aurantimonas sp. C2-6-R+9]MEC5414174.1 DUF4241 domain-containing protein [Aurantimonas sp. C2-4-R8]
MKVTDVAGELGEPNEATRRVLRLTSLFPSALARRRITRFEVCVLQCPTGRILACDPIVDPQTAPCFVHNIRPGRYPAYVYLYDHREYVSLGTVVMAELRFGRRRVETWQLARFEDTGSYARDGYSVDSAKGASATLPCVHFLICPRPATIRSTQCWKIFSVAHPTVSSALTSKAE